MLLQSFTLISLFLPSFISALTCPSSDPKVYQLPSGQCFFVEARPHLNRTTFEETENECGILGEGSHRWYLPKLDSENKSIALVEAIRNVTEMNYWMIWVGLHRNTPIDLAETWDVSKWADKSKWRWTMDMTTLADSFPFSQPPWLPMEPTNGQFRQTRKPADMERCVVAEMNQARQLSSPRWYDMSCEVRASHFLDALLHSYVFVCESESAVKSQGIPSYQKPTQQPMMKGDFPRPFPWHILLLVAFFVVIVVGTTVVVIYVKRKMKAKLMRDIRMVFRNGHIEDQQAPQVEGDTTDDKERFF